MTRRNIIEPGKPVHVGQGEYAIEDSEDARIMAVLGSCVAACLWDPERKIGGMNHILLPGSADASLATSSHAVNAMELLINGLLREGADKQRLQAKLFGGASMMTGLGDIGRRNAEVTMEFLKRESIPCVSSSLGGTSGRKVQFWPASGRARQVLIGAASEIKEPVAPPPAVTVGSELELF